MPLGTRRLDFARQRPLASAFSKLPSQHNNFRPTAIARAPGKFFRFNSSLKRGISLLRRGARDFSLHFATQTQQKPLWGRPRGFHLDCARAQRLKSLFMLAGDLNTVFDWPQAGRAALTPGGRCLSALGMGLRARKVTNIRLPNSSYPLNSPPLRSLAKVQKYRPPSAQRTKEDRFFIWPLERPFLKSKNVCFTPYCPRPSKGG